MSKPTNEWYCKDLRNTVINRQKREINKLNKENEKMWNKIKEKIKQEEKLLENETVYGVIKYREGKVQALKELLEEG